MGHLTLKLDDILWSQAHNFKLKHNLGTNYRANTISLSCKQTHVNIHYSYHSLQFLHSFNCMSSVNKNYTFAGSADLFRRKETWQGLWDWLSILWSFTFVSWHGMWSFLFSVSSRLTCACGPTCILLHPVDPHCRWRADHQWWPPAAVEAFGSCNKSICFSLFLKKQIWHLCNTYIKNIVKMQSLIPKDLEAHIARVQTFFRPDVRRWTVAKARSWLIMPETWAGK